MLSFYNSRLYTLHIYAVDEAGLVLDADQFAEELRNLTIDEISKLETAGFSINYAVKGEI